MTGIPCNHGVSAIHKAKLNPEDFVNDFFKKPMYQEAYNPIVCPVPGPDLWPKTGTPDIVPPVFKEKPGKKQTKRRKNQFEKPTPKETSRMGSITCSNCNLTGHRYTSCHKALKLALEMRRNQHQIFLYKPHKPQLLLILLILCSNLSSYVVTVGKQES
jgi:hypothetical protein